MASKLKIDLTEDIKHLSIIVKSMVTSRTMGRYKSKFKGKGLEFSNYRAYNLGYDDAQYIDWKASKRANELLIKEYVEERNMNVFFLIDVSSTMVYGSTKLLKMEYAAHLTASLFYVIIGAGDNAGFALYSDRVVAKQAPTRGKDAFYKLSSALLDINNYGGRADLGEAIKLSLAFLKQNDIMIIISDFIGLKPGWEQTLKIAAQKYELIAIMVRDPNDRTLPIGVGQVAIESPFSSKQLLIQPELVKTQYERYVKEEERQVKDKFIQMKADVLTLQTDEPYIKPISRFFKAREAR